MHQKRGEKCTTPLPLLPEWDPGILPPMSSPISNPLRLITALSLSWAASASFSAPAPTQPEPQKVTIALVDTFSPDFYIHTYSPTLDHLIETLPQFRFNIIEIDRRDVARGIAREKPDFLVTSGSTFVELIDAAGAHQIATRQPSESSDVSRTLASTFIVRANSRYRNLESVRGLRAAVSDLTSFDGWLIAEGEIAKRGADPEKYFSAMLETQYGIPDVASLVKLGIADVGVLGTCEYEELLRNGTISRRDFRILEEKPSDGGCVRSTDRYPDAVFSSLPNATSEMVRQITVALLSMPTKSVEFKWTVCNDFVPTFELLRTLKIGPFVALRDTSLAALWERYRTEILLALAFGLAVLFHVITINLLVRRRTRELSESLAQTKRFFMEARDAREKLLRLERASIVSQLSAMFAHEIKQPILNIALYAGSMRLLLRKSGTLTPKAESILDAVQGEIDRSSDIVEHVRGYARHQERDRVPCDLSDIVRQSAAMMTKEHPELKLGALPQSPILADPFEIQFIVENFLRNAFSAVKGSPDAAVLAEVRPFRGGWRLDVLDNGPKLSVEAFRKLGTAGTTTKAEGLGFGLAIARAIAERNGGHLEFRQLGERGLLVSLILPGIDVAADDEAAAEDGSGGRESSTTDRTDRTDEEDGRHA